MATYTPTALSPVDAFSATTVAGDFDELSRVLNSTIGDYASGERNIPGGRATLDFLTFRRNSVVETFRSADLRVGGASGDESFVVSIQGTGGDSESPWGVWKNRFDVSGSGLNFYLRAPATVQIQSQVSLRRTKSGHPFNTAPSSTTNNKGVVGITANLRVDNATVQTLGADFFIGNSTTFAFTMFQWDDIRGRTISFNYVGAFHAGLHKAHIELVFSGITTAFVSGNVTSAYSAIHIIGHGGRTCATAFYK